MNQYLYYLIDSFIIDYLFKYFDLYYIKIFCPFIILTDPIFQYFVLKNIYSIEYYKYYNKKIYFIKIFDQTNQ